jgi:hypothetical protein
LAAFRAAREQTLLGEAKPRDDSQKFFADQKLPGTERILQNAKEPVNACIELRTMQTRNLAEYLGKEASKQEEGR